MDVYLYLLDAFYVSVVGVATGEVRIETVDTTSYEEINFVIWTG